MRKVARTSNHPSIQQVILFEDSHGVYLFASTSVDDGFCNDDQWYENLEMAEAECFSEFGISSKEWQVIPDPMEYCQHDWIEPVRIIGRERGEPQWGHFEKLVDGIWKEIELINGKWILKAN